MNATSNGQSKEIQQGSDRRGVVSISRNGDGEEPASDAMLPWAGKHCAGKRIKTDTSRRQSGSCAERSLVAESSPPPPFFFLSYRSQIDSQINLFRRFKKKDRHRSWLSHNPISNQHSKQQRHRQIYQMKAPQRDLFGRAGSCVDETSKQN